MAISFVFEPIFEQNINATQVMVEGDKVGL